MSRTQSQAPRSWTEIDQPVKRRPAVIAGLFLLLLAALIAFVWWLIPRAEHRVFAFGFSVEEYREEQFEWPAFARWNLSDTPMETWSPWLMSDVDGQSVTVASEPKNFCARIEGEPQLRDIPESIQQKFRDSTATPSDTLIVYLRGHSLAVPSNKTTAEPHVVLLAPEASASESPPKGFDLEDLLNGLGKIKAANIVVLADITDLSRAPQIGLLENEVPSTIAQLMLRIGNGTGEGRSTPVWLILPRGSKQPNHVSYLLRKTLLQSAAEYALANLSAIDGQKHLPLTEFYEAVLRFSHHVTGGTQLPMLFRSGHGAAIQDLNSAIWKEAASVHMALRHQERTLPDKLPTELIPASIETPGPSGQQTANLSSSTNQSNAGHFVSSLALQSEESSLSTGSAFAAAEKTGAAVASGQKPAINASSAVSDTSGSAGTSGSASTSGSATGTDAPTTELEKDPWLRFWQLRDELASQPTTVGGGRGWSPTDFCVDRWQKLQRAALQRGRLWNLSQGLASASVQQVKLLDEVQDLKNELERLARELKSNTLGNSSGQSLPEAWIRFRSSLDSAKNPQRPWLDPSLLASDLQPQWAEQRNKLRQFIDVCCESTAWMELYLESDIYGIVPGTRQENNEIVMFRQLIERLIDQISAFKEQFAGRKTLLDRPIDFRTLDNLLVLHRQLRQELNRVTNDYKGRLESNVYKLTWRDELTIQTLLSSPLLTYIQRRSLQVYYSSPETLKPRLLRPGNENENYDLDVPLSDLLQDPFKDDVDLRLWNRKLPELLAGEGSVDAWLRACFSVIMPGSKQPDQASNPAGMILPVSSDTALSVFRLDAKHQLPNPLRVMLRHRNGTSMDYCWLDWKQLSSGDNNRYRLTASLTGSSDPLPSGSLHHIPLSRDEFSIVFRPATADTVPIEGIPVELRLARQESELQDVEPKRVLILPENPNRVDLLVRRWDLARDQLEEKIYATVDFQNNAVLRGIIRVPAVGHQAQSQYQLYLCNRSAKDRVIRARLFGANSPLDSGNGEMTGEAISGSRDVRNLQLIASVNSLALSGSPLTSQTDSPGQLPNNAKELILPALETGPKSLGNFGLVLIIDDAPPEGTSPPGLLGKPQYIWLDCLSQSPCPLGKPTEWLVQIEPRRDDGTDVDFEVSVADEIWSRWGIEKLDVNILVTNEKREKIDNRNSSGVELSPKSSQSTLSVRPNFDSLPRGPDKTLQRPEKILVHFSIGGYPRATVFEYRESGSISASAEGSLWLEPTTNTDAEPDAADLGSVIALLEGDKQLPVSRMGLDSRTFIIPNRVGATDTSRGTAVKADRLVVPYRLDFPRDARNYSAIVVLGSLTPELLKHDRIFQPLIDVVNGRLSLKSSSQDLRFTVLDLSSKTMLQNRQPLSVSVDGTNLRDEVSFIFDSQEPQISQVELPGGKNLYEGGSIRVELSAADAESDIQEVFFAINRERVETVRKYDDQDIEGVKANLVKDKWTATFKHDALADAGILGEPGNDEHFIVARSIDLAGNVQDAHVSGSFFWQGKKKTAQTKPTRK